MVFAKFCLKSPCRLQTSLQRPPIGPGSYTLQYDTTEKKANQVPRWTKEVLLNLSTLLKYFSLRGMTHVCRSLLCGIPIQPWIDRNYCLLILIRGFRIESIKRSFFRRVAWYPGAGPL